MKIVVSLVARNHLYISFNKQLSVVFANIVECNFNKRHFVRS
jgi:hypothetical protein